MKCRKIRSGIEPGEQLEAARGRDHGSDVLSCDGFVHAHRSPSTLRNREQTILRQRVDRLRTREPDEHVIGHGFDESDGFDDLSAGLIDPGDRGFDPAGPAPPEQQPLEQPRIAMGERGQLRDRSRLGLHESDAVDHRSRIRLVDTVQIDPDNASGQPQSGDEIDRRTG